MTSPALSVLDLVPVRTDQTTAAALAASRSLAQTADALGFRRYWVAEHHNVPAVAATNPPVLIALLAGATERIRVGSGGVMLPNHAPLVIAEQFALLEAAFPGRIDLGIGRAPGTDPVTSWALRGGMTGDEGVRQFPEHVEHVVAMMAPDGVGLSVGGRTQPLRATPVATAVPDLWLLGSSDYSADLAAEKGLPYVFAHHFSGRGTAEALARYRSQYQPSERHPRPRTFLTVNLVVADTREEAELLALPHLHAMLSLRTGGSMGPQPLIEDAARRGFQPHEEALLAEMLAPWIIDTPPGAAAAMRELAETHGVDEVMVHPVAGAHAGTPADQSVERERTLQLLVSAL